MEQLVARKMKEIESRALSWDPDEYTLAFRQQLKRQREEAEAEKAHNTYKDKNSEAENS